MHLITAPPLRTVLLNRYCALASNENYFLKYSAANIRTLYQVYHSPYEPEEEPVGEDQKDRRTSCQAESGTCTTNNLKLN